ncbi:fumarylacetoacetate hydrolase family protein [Actinoplanes sp. LDG1-06]|uniref:Fumarylacetoacetate hydrolase family protein n=1 Tax=Paractinoplanes ovalisporus TaxID=2810368 RepID=A0ABS2AN88_9ACTN|nr:fumarylacetoacetate hydrolase family protein [Actinoplanes ovalisporus]MBM2620691.1 fumarylacetoacetate hydrolase family protein [Actinoplanes ovalisporus]
MTSPAAQRLLDAVRTGVPCAPVRDLIGAEDIAAAYAVQREQTELRLKTRRLVGHKIGLTSPAVQKQLGVDQPDFGVLFEDMDVSGLDPVPVSGLLQPRIEAEVAFLLKADLVGDFTAEDVRAAVDVMAPALEIVDSRVAGWDISIADTIADNASSGLFVLGAARKTLDEVNPVDIQMEMTVGGEVVSKGSGAACLGDPLAALAWLATAARDYGDPLRAGQVVLSGALGPMVPVTPGMRVSATLTGLGTVATNFGDA